MVAAESWERFYEAGNLAIARALLDTAITEYIRALKAAADTNDHFAQAKILRALAKTYLDINKIREAKLTVSKAKELDIKFWGEDNEHVAEDTFILAEVIRREGGLVEARALYKEALALRTALFSESDGQTLDVLLRLIWTGLEEGRYEELAKSTDNAYRVFRVLQPAGAFGKWLKIKELLNPYLIEKRYLEAELICERVIKVLRSVFGDKNLDLSAVLNDCADAMKEANRHLNSWSLRSRAESINDLHSLEGQVDSLIHQGKYQQAEYLLRRLLANLRKRTAPDKTVVSKTLKQYYDVLFEQGRFNDADVLQRQTHNWEVTYNATSKESASPLFWF